VFAQMVAYPLAVVPPASAARGATSANSFYNDGNGTIVIPGIGGITPSGVCVRR
jgi:hypothetical protein